MTGPWARLKVAALSLPSWPRRLFLDSWKRIDEEAALARTTSAAFDSRPLVILIACALVMVFQEYVGDRGTFESLFAAEREHWHYYLLGSYAWWSASKLVGYILVPFFVVSIVYRESLGDYGLRLRGAGRHLWIYFALYLAMLPVLVIASGTQAFIDTYPFYKLANRSWFDLICWELMYGSTFFALELFFRGFLLFGLKRNFGAQAIFVMIVPYCMIHFHKPVAEVVGAIFAGIALGTLSLATRSIWCGVALHVSIAWTMDALSLMRAYGWPGHGRTVVGF